MLGSEWMVSEFKMINGLCHTTTWDQAAVHTVGYEPIIKSQLAPRH